MLRMIFKNNDWRWQAFGKHPSASEYLRPLNGSPLQSAVFSWMEQGFELLSDDLKSAGDLAWSFWMKGPNGKMLCGRLASSSDRFGRTYPLMLIGEGVSGNTEENWDLIPFACEESWGMLKSTALEVSDGQEPLQQRLKHIQSPKVDWKKQSLRREELKSVKVVSGPIERSTFMMKMQAVDVLARRPAFSLPFDDEHLQNYYIPSHKFLSLLKTRIQHEPHMVFLGGAKEAKSLTVLQFPPRVQDFVMLWENGDRRRRGL